MVIIICATQKEDLNDILKEDACMSLLDYSLRHDKNRYDAALAEKQNLRKKELRDKIAENGFEFCVKTIPATEAEKVMVLRGSEYPKYYKYLPILLDNLNNPEDLAPDSNWGLLRRQIKKRLSKYKRLRMVNKNDL